MKFITHFSVERTKEQYIGWMEGLKNSWKNGSLIIPPYVNSFTIIDETDDNKIVYRYDAQNQEVDSLKKELYEEGDTNVLL